MIIIKSHKCSSEKLRNDYPGAVIIDVTSHAKDEFIRLSPFYPHGGIPVPFSPGWSASCVEAVWQGLKDYESVGIDTDMFSNTSMKNIKRTTRRFGVMKGHRKGVSGKEELGYIQARKLIYLPTYRWVLENKVRGEIEKLRQLSSNQVVILLDYATNPNVDDASSPLSHAALIKAFIEGTYPSCESIGSSREEPAGEPGVSFRVGQRVSHPVFGEGVISFMEGERALINFDKEGEKLMAFRYARLSLA